MRSELLANILNARFHDLLLGHDFAKRQLGFIHTLDLEYGEPMPSRTLLEVEVHAEKKRNQQHSKQSKYHAEVSADLHQQIEADIFEKLNDLDYIYYEVSKIQDAVPTIMDILAVKSASVGRLDPLVKDLTWLGSDLLKLINLPQYRQDKDPKKSVKVDNPSLALRYLGIENLKFVIPTFALQHWTPHSTQPFRLLKRKLWENGMASAICARELAQMHDLNPYQAFTLGMFHDVGKIALARLYLHTFEQIWQDNVTQARDDHDKDRHTALISLSPDPLFLRNLMLEQSYELSKRLLEKMAFRYLPLSGFMAELHNISEPRDMSPMGRVVAKAICFAQYKKLKEHGLVEPDEVKKWFTHMQFSRLELKNLSSISLTNLQLKIER